MNSLVENPRLWWKELRQLAPLVGLLIALVPMMVALHSILGFYDNSQYSATSFSVFSITAFVLGMPGLFAIGVGAILVGQEKEQRTMSWLVCLPLTPAQIISRKLQSGLLMLTAVWMICMPIAAFVFRDNIDRLTVEKVLFWIVFSLFLLMSSLAINWRINGALASLFTLVPVVLIPFIGFALIEDWLRRTGVKDDIMVDRISIGILSALALVGYFLVYRFGQLALAPESASSVSSASSASGRDAVGWLKRLDALGQRYRSKESAAGYRRLTGPTRALIWQTSIQSKFFWLAISAMLLVSLAVALFRIRTNQLGTSSSRFWADTLSLDRTAMMISHLAVCWMGVLAFAGDNLSQRVRFLADRGVSPGRVWVTRHFPAVIILSSYFLLLVVGLIGTPHYRLSVPDLLLVTTSTAVYLITVYSVSQWIGQMFRTPVIAVIAATIGSTMFVLYALGFLSMFGAAWWLIGLICLLPLGVTWFYQRAWMDHRLDVRFWISQAIILVSLGIVSVLPGLWQVYRTPDLEPQRKIEILNYAVATGLSPVRGMTIYLMEGAKNRIDSAASIESSSTKSDAEAQFELSSTDRLQDYQERELNWIARSLDDSDGPIDLLNSQPCVNFLTGFARMTRQGWLSKMADARSLSLYRSSLESIGKLISRGRKSNWLYQQDLVDRLEIAVLEELTQPDALKRLEPDLYRKLVNQVGDRQLRNDARRMAMAHEYHEVVQHFQDNPYVSAFYNIDYIANFGWVGQALTTKKAGIAYGRLWELLERTPGSNVNELIEEIAESWNKKVTDYAAYQSGDSELPAISPELRGIPIYQLVDPGVTWNGNWEVRAAELRDDLERRDDQPVPSSSEDGVIKSEPQSIAPANEN